jgi:hypothetical protein
METSAIMNGRHQRQELQAVPAISMQSFSLRATPIAVLQHLPKDFSVPHLSLCFHRLSFLLAFLPPQRR